MVLVDLVRSCGYALCLHFSAGAFSGCDKLRGLHALACMCCMHVNGSLFRMTRMAADVYQHDACQHGIDKRLIVHARTLRTCEFMHHRLS
jgi:hypothetical protein